LISNVVLWIWLPQYIFIAELKGNPAKIRNYPRSCKSFDALNVIIFLKIRPLQRNHRRGKAQKAGKSEDLPYHNHTF